MNKSATIADVARAAGVAKSTASGAFSGNKRMAPATRAAILEAARRLEFEPNPHAQRLSNGRSHDSVGVLSLSLDSVGVEKVRLIQRVLMGRGYDVSLSAYDCYREADETHAVDLLRTMRRAKPRAIVCNLHWLRPELHDELRRFQDEGGLAVCYDGAAADECDSVIFDRDDNTYQATRHLLDAGHRKVGLMMHGPPAPVGPRLRGFERALHERGLSARPEWMFCGSHSLDPESAGSTLADEFLALDERPSAMCIVNDASALVFMARVMRAGVRVPQDVSIVGHDDKPIAPFCPVPLSTVAHPTRRIASEVVRLLLSRLDGEYDGPPRHVTLRGDLVPRDSVAPPTN